MKTTLIFVTGICILFIISNDKCFSQIQSDSSDAVWSIVMPEPASTDIDMLQCLIGSSKDSVVVEFIQNVGSWKFRVDSIYFQGADADAFSLVSGFPKYIIESNQSQYGEFNFKPNRVGVHTAEIVIITQAETLTQNIRGEGVVPSLEVVNDFIDFGKVLVSENRDSLGAVTIKNIGTFPLEINDTKHNFPNDVDFTTLSGGGNFILQPDDVTLMDLRFKPSDVGRTSGTLEFYYDGVGSPAIVQLFGEGVILGASKVILKTIETEGFPGDEIIVPIILQNQENMLQSGATSIKVDLEFNPTLLYPLDHDFNIIDNKTAKITIENLPIDKSDGEVLTNIRFKVGLGNAESCKLTLSNAETVGGKVEIQVVDGNFTLLGICEEGGTRLLNPYSKAGIKSISPNPAEDLINIELSVSEFGNTELSIYNLLGEKVSTIFSESVSRKSIIEVSSDISKIGSGQYLLIFRTPTYTETRQIIIMR